MKWFWENVGKLNDMIDGWGMILLVMILIF